MGQEKIEFHARKKLLKPAKKELLWYIAMKGFTNENKYRISELSNI